MVCPPMFKAEIPVEPRIIGCISLDSHEAIIPFIRVDLPVHAFQVRKTDLFQFQSVNNNFNASGFSFRFSLAISL
jgi:hypothetical protein